LRRARALPSVRAAEATNALPLGKSDSISLLVTSVGHPAPKDFADRFALNVYVTAGFLRTLGVPLLCGRHLTSDDREGAAPVAVVNQAFAMRFFGGALDAIDQQVVVPGSDTPVQIVGVVANVRHFSLTAPPVSQLYRPAAQGGAVSTVLLRSAASPRAILPPLRSIVRSVDPEVAVFQVASVSELIRAASSPERLLSSVMTGFGVVALLLSSIGVYAATSASVMRRRQELRRFASEWTARS